MAIDDERKEAQNELYEGNIFRLADSPVINLITTPVGTHFQRTFSAHSVHIQRTFNAHSLHIQRTFDAHSTHTQRTSNAK